MNSVPKRSYRFFITVLCLVVLCFVVPCLALFSGCFSREDGEASSLAETADSETGETAASSVPEPKPETAPEGNPGGSDPESPEGSSGAAEASEAAPSGRASRSGSEQNGDLTYTTWKGTVLSDFSFLNGLSRNYFSDVDTAADPNGSWYCGKTTRDPATGEETLLWDRAQDVLDTIERYGVIYRAKPEQKVLYLTFDCGYENGYTEQILDILKEKQVPAAFFLNGYYVSSAPELVRRMLDEGHIVGNHGNNHKVMPQLGLDEFLYEVESVNDLMAEYVPDSPYMTYFRPSYGSCSPWDIALITAMDLTETLYSWTYYDYDPDDQMAPSDALQLAKDGIYSGSVIMLHTVGSTNVQILGDFIDYARSEGYTFQSLDDYEAAAS